jgi:energy-coupling factor transport system substrate-specific component
VAFTGFCFALGFAFGLLMNLWHWYGFYPHTAAALGVVLGTSFAFDAAHALGNVVLALVAGPELRRVLTRYERQLRTEVAWAAA